MHMNHWRERLRDVPDFPRPASCSRTSRRCWPIVTRSLRDRGDGRAVARSTDRRRGGIESRGFILGAALALALHTGFVPVRKPGKLPAATLSLDYALEYGSDRLQIHADALPPGARVLVVDDVLATGGTLKAALALVRLQGAEVIGAAVLLELGLLCAREHWDDSAPLLAAAVF